MKVMSRACKKLHNKARLGRCLTNRTMKVIRLSFISLMLATPGCTSTELQWLRENTPVFSAPLKVKTGKVTNIVKTDRPAGWGIAMHPFLIRFPLGRIALDYYAVGDTDRPTGFSELDWPLYSDDGGITWIHGDPFARPGEPRDDRRIVNKGDVLPKKNLIHLPYAGNLALASNRYVCYRYSNPFTNVMGRWTGPDGFWRDPETSTINLPPEQYRRSLYLQYGDVDTAGNIYLTAYHLNPVNQREGFRTIMLISRDGGAHFDYLSTVALPDDVPDSTEGPCEPGMVILPDGEMVVVMRTGGHVPRKMLMARSRNSGKTWTLSDMPFSGVQPKLVLMSNGVLVLATGRPGNILHFSTDGGHTWPRSEVIGNGGSSGYIDIMEVSPGRLLAVYDLMNQPDPTVPFGQPVKVNGIYSMFIDVDYTPPGS